MTSQPTPTFEALGHVLLGNARREHPMLTPGLRRWIEEACRRLGIGIQADKPATPNRGGPPEPVMVSPEALTPAAQTACFELLAMLHNEKSDLLTIYLNNVTVQGAGRHSFEISVRRT